MSAVASAHGQAGRFPYGGQEFVVAVVEAEAAGTVTNVTVNMPNYLGNRAEAAREITAEIQRQGRRNSTALSGNGIRV